MPKEQKKLSPQEILLKIASYCAYQERCHNEVLHKLAEWGVYGQEADQQLLKLIEQNYVNEERFAKAYAGGKFRVKHWGRLKIKRELKLRGISDYCIQLALKEIEDNDYQATLLKLVQDKMATLKGKHPLEANRKIYHHVATKGYEGDLIMDAIKQVKA
ncbi:MAG: RecX family transcriptional regulator [Bacteroidetes bacterium B1(2017)]|nr:MAG: RecX family transcriptional regulator [Bacteroidetes bacterium B1(2017)]